MEFLKRGATINARTCKEVKTKNLEVSANQEDESNPNPTKVPGVASSYWPPEGCTSCSIL
jgi:hypothetical protein